VKYRARAFGADIDLSVEREGLRIGRQLLDYADVNAIRPVNHRVLIDTRMGAQVEVSMLGFSYDGFLEELLDSYGKRSLEALFVDEERLMLCEGEYAIPGESGRGKIALYPDAVCVLPQTSRAVRIPLCFTERIWLDAYRLHLIMQDGEKYIVSKMGYDTEPFAERAEKAADLVKRKRADALKTVELHTPFTLKGLFRTETPGLYWNAAFGDGVCAVELFTDEDSATYLYRLREPRESFQCRLEEAMEAMGTHREIIYLTEEQLAEKTLYRMSVDRMAAVRFLRDHSDGRLVHSANHAERLQKYLG